MQREVERSMAQGFEFEQGVPPFGGTAPLFPLPNLVVFPGIVQPLHIFEPRYRTMLRHVLAGDGYLAMALLKSGYEPTYHLKSCPVFPTVCLGQVIQHEELPDGRFNLLFKGLSRAVISAEMDNDQPFRTGRLELWGDEACTDPTDAKVQAERLKARFLQCMQSRLKDADLDKIFPPSMPFGMLCDLIAFALPSRPSLTQRVLEARNLCQRAGLVSDLLSRVEAGRDAPGFPPPFSAN